MKRAFVVLSVLLVALVNVVFAQKPSVVTSKEPGWHKIGETTASFKMQNESIVVLGADEFAAIKLKVTDAPINIERLEVFYESGAVQEIDVRDKLQEGAQTRTIDLKDGEEIKKVAFTYQTITNYRGEKAHVELYGYKNAGDDNRSDSYRDERREREMERAAERTEDDIEDAAEDVDKDINEAAENTEEEAREAKEETKDGVDKLGDKISEAAANAAAEVNDQMYKGKMGPHGENIYINKHDKYYYINDEGKKVFLLKSELRDKPKKD